MKTVAQLAQEIGVSKQAIHKKIKREPLATQLRELIVTKGNTVYISKDGEFLIKSTFVIPTEDTPQETTGNQNDIQQNQLTTELYRQIELLTAQNKALQEELSLERKHNRELTDRVVELAENATQLASNAQKLHASEIMPRLEAETAEGGQGFFAQWFSRRKRKHEEDT